MGGFGSKLQWLSGKFDDQDTNVFEKNKEKFWDWIYGHILGKPADLSGPATYTKGVAAPGYKPAAIFDIGPSTPPAYHAPPAETDKALQKAAETGLEIGQWAGAAATLADPWEGPQPRRPSKVPDKEAMDYYFGPQAMANMQRDLLHEMGIESKQVGNQVYVLDKTGGGESWISLRAAMNRANDDPELLKHVLGHERQIDWQNPWDEMSEDTPAPHGQWTDATAEVALRRHGIPTTRHNGRLYAEESWEDQYGSPHTKWVDVTDYTADQMREYLGY